MADSAAEVIRPLRRAEYDQLVLLGAFQDERIELLDGVLVAMTPIGRPHSSTVQRLNRLLILALEGRAAVTCQSPFAANELSEPEPDFLVCASAAIEVYTEPTPSAYSRVARYEPGQLIALAAFPDLSFAVSDVLK